jgi:hypothetical protein
VTLIEGLKNYQNGGSTHSEASTEEES